MCPLGSDEDPKRYFFDLILSAYLLVVVPAGSLAFSDTGRDLQALLLFHCITTEASQQGCAKVKLTGSEILYLPQVADPGNTI